MGNTPEYMAEWYAKNRTAHCQRVAQDRKRRRKVRQRFIQALKDVPCADCGVKYPYYVMDFDHVRGKKEFNISEASARDIPMAKLLAEAEKCDVVCSNCHRERTHGSLAQ